MGIKCIKNLPGEMGKVERIISDSKVNLRDTDHGTITTFFIVDPSDNTDKMVDKLKSERYSIEKFEKGHYIRAIGGPGYSQAESFNKLIYNIVGDDMLWGSRSLQGRHRLSVVVPIKYDGIGITQAVHDQLVLPYVK